MTCNNSCRLCDRLIISTAVAFTGGNLVVTIPAGSYADGCKYCIVITQSIPDTTTINAPVVIQIGSGPVLYPVTKRNCAPLTARNANTRTKYSVVVHTTADSGTFRLLGNPCCTSNNNLRAINGEGTSVTATAEVESLAVRKGAK